MILFEPDNAHAFEASSNLAEFRNVELPTYRNEILGGDCHAEWLGRGERCPGRINVLATSFPYF